VPTYSYACTECDNRFDAVQAFSDDALTTCEKCSGRLRKLFGSVGVVFKGSGFYRNDSRESAKSSSNGSAKSSSSSSSEGSSSSDTSSSSEKSTSSSSSSSSSTDKSDSSSKSAATTSS
jgi:putative FmdB family regulatory protein